MPPATGGSRVASRTSTVKVIRTCPRTTCQEENDWLRVCARAGPDAGERQKRGDQSGKRHSP